jgi:Tol biopolymer transport system component
VICPVDFRVTDSEPAWSPDGSTIAYVHGDTLAGKTGIYFIDPDGKNKRLFYASIGANAPTWSPDGEWIAFSDNAQIYKIKATGDSLTQLTFEGRNFFPAWSPDGQWIAYDRSYAYPESPDVQGIWIMCRDGKNRNRIANGRFPDWHANGEDLIFVGWYDSTKGGIIQYNLQSKNQKLIFDGTTNDNRFPKYSPNGTKIALTSQELSRPSKWPQIWVMDADGTNLRQLTTTQGYTCDWSPDGEWIVYTDSRAVNGRLWIMRNDGSNPRQLTFD